MPVPSVKTGNGSSILTKSLLFVGITFILCFLFWGIAKNREYHQQANNEVREQSAYVYRKVEQACVGKTTLETVVCIDAALSERRSKTREEYNLISQRQSVLWAFIAGIFSMSLSAVGVGLVWLTFREQRRTNDLTRAEAEAAKEETNALAKSFLEAQRPRIFATRLEEVPDQEIVFRINLANSGKSPAIIENISLVVYKNGQPVKSCGNKLFEKFIISGSEERTISNPTIGIIHIHDDDSETTIGGTVDYSDVHSIRRRHGFSFTVGLGSMGQNIINPEVRKGAWFDEQVRSVDMI